MSVGLILIECAPFFVLAGLGVYCLLVCFFRRGAMRDGGTGRRITDRRISRWWAKIFGCGSRTLRVIWRSVRRSFFILPGSGGAVDRVCWDTPFAGLPAAAPDILSGLSG